MNEMTERAEMTGRTGVTERTESPPGTKLTVEPGVIVIGLTSGDSFVLGETSYPHRTMNDKITSDVEAIQISSPPEAPRLMHGWTWYIV
jgi:hypothetical protein